MMQRGFSNISIIHTKDNTLQDELAWLVLELKTFFVLFSRVYLAFWSKRMCRYRKRISDVARNDDIFINSRMTNCIFYLFIVLFNVVERPQNISFQVSLRSYNGEVFSHLFSSSLGVNKTKMQLVMLKRSCK